MALRNRIERRGAGWSISEADAPTGEMADTMRRRLASLERHLAPADRRAIAAEVGRLLASYPGAGDAQAAKALLTAHVSVLGEFPAWAVAAGCNALLRRDSSFAPAPGEVRKSVLAQVVEFSRERHALFMILSAKPRRAATAGERERIKAGLAALRAELAGAR
jgi:hypothetical protein